LKQAGLAEVPQFAMPRVEGLVEGVAQVVRRDDAEGPHGGESAALGAAQHVAVVAYPDVLAFASARQIDVAREHLPRLDAFPLPLARICSSAAAPTQVTRAILALPRFVAPAWVGHRQTP
jgi:hypothetical protein